jgi:Tfp pilus assembly protein PilX
MKRNVLMIMVAVAAFTIIGCGDTEDKANLSFKNSTNSEDKINDIVWADGNETWNSIEGYDIGATTEKKEVTKLNGDVTASVKNNLGDFVDADIVISETTSQSLSLADGSTNTYTIVATLGASAPKKK